MTFSLLFPFYGILCENGNEFKYPSFTVPCLNFKSLLLPVPCCSFMSKATVSAVYLLELSHRTHPMFREWFHHLQYSAIV